MRAPVSWLAEYIDGLAAFDVETIDAAFVRSGLEVEAIHRFGVGFSGPVVVGRVLEFEQLAGFKKPIRYAQVDVGEDETRGIVCGATNFAAGDLIVAALPGAVLPGDFAIAARKTYGHISDGMICSARELGLGDEHAGILVLPPSDLPPEAVPGADARAVLGLDDVVFELAITPDLGHCFSVRGLARELALSLALPYVDPAALDVPAPSDEPPYPVQVVDTAGCDRFSARAVRGLDPSAASPLWMVRRLLLSGVRSISLAVDVTNYVMLELGQPMHAFDRNSLSGPVVVRRAVAGERVRTLDDVDRATDPEDLLITDDTGPIGLAAVMGGATSEVSEKTTDVLLEAAHWDPASVARTARRHKLPSEASKRFERGVDPALGPVANERAVQLLVRYGGATADPGVLDLDHRPERPLIALPVALPGRIAGVSYDRATVERRIADTGSEVVSADDDVLTVRPASWRADLTDPIDLVEEVIRLEGYDRIPSVLPATPASAGLTPDQRRRRRLSRALAEAGHVEVLTYPFNSPDVHDAFGLPDGDPRRRTLRLANPIDGTEPELRSSLLPGLLKALARNVSRGAKDVALFEVGVVYLPRTDAPSSPRLPVDRAPTDDEQAALAAAVPDQPRHVGVVLAGDRDPAGWWGDGRPASWADAIEAARTVVGGALVVRQTEHAPWHPGRCAELLVGDVVVGHAGELHPRVVATLGLPARTAAAEIDLAAVPLPPVVTAPTLSAFPAALLDVALVVPADVPAEDVRQALVDGAGELLESIRLFDLYTGAQAGDGQKSLAFAVTLRAGDRTLTADDVAAVRAAAVAEATSRTGARLRE